MTNLIRIQPERVKFGIVVKLGILLAVFGVLAAGLTGYYTYQATREILVKKAGEELVQSTRIMGRRFSNSADAVARDALMFAGTPDARDVFGGGQTAEVARLRMAAQFRSLLAQHSEYYQVRLISAQNNGIERVRVDRDGSSLKTVSGADLQEKMQYPYVYETLRLAEGDVHYSRIFINREAGAHSGQKKPTLQVATPVAGPDGKVAGVMVINVNLNKIFARLNADLRSEYQLYLTNQAGDFLVAPDSAKTFGFDYGRRYLVQDTFKPVSAIIDKRAETIAVRTVSDHQAVEVVGGFARIPFGHMSGSDFVIIGMTVPLDFVLAETAALTRNSRHIVIGFSLAAILMSVLVAFIFVRPLKRLVVAVQRFSQTRTLTPIDVDSRDELGLLAKSVSQMQEHILGHLADLNKQNKKLQQEIAERERMEHYEQFRSDTLELLAANNTISVILESIVRGVERLHPEMLCSILLLDKEGKHLLKGAAPGLPDFYNAAIDGAAIGMGEGSCGTAAFTGERVIVEDIQTHPYWVNYKALAVQAGLGACWSQPILSSAGKVLGTFAIYHHDAHRPEESDIALIEQAARLVGIAIEHKQAEDALHYSEQRFRDVSDAAGEYLWEVDENSVYTYVSRRAVDVKGYTPEELLGQTPMAFMPSEDIPLVQESIHQAIANKAPFRLQHRDITRSGAIHWEEVNGVPFYDEKGKLLGLRGTGMNITERKQTEEAINSLAFYDALTGLPNRRLLMDRLLRALTSSARSKREGALLFIDLDNFKTLNDTLGHDVGDLLLQQVALRLQACVREGDTVARLGGDEFVVVLEDLSEQVMDAATQTEMLGEAILHALSQPYLLGSQPYRNTPSIGATLFYSHDQGPEELMKQADIAMYQAKKAGRNTLRFFDPRMQDNINARAQLEAALRNGLAAGEFQLYYQIQVDDAQQPLGAEALIRWIHPERGMVLPAEFIFLAEETGLILPIGTWVLETACAQLKAWQQSELARELVLAVNVSAKQFRQPDFVVQLRELVERHAISPALLKLELTESLLLDDTEETIATMNDLSEIGIQFSLDDFGAGYSSLQYIKRLPIDQLKIDQSFVRDIVVDGSDKAIVRTIIAMAHSLDLNVIAEGVETEAQRLSLLSKGCTHYQGYLFSKPVPITQFDAALQHDALKNKKIK